MSRAGAPAIHVLGGVAIVIMGLNHRGLPQIVLAFGVIYCVAWLATRQADRFLASGAVLLGLGAALVLSDHGSLADYDQELVFTGIAAGLLLCLLAGHRIGPGAISGLGFVALSEAALAYLPPHINAPDVWKAFNEGWAFGVLQIAFGVALLAPTLRARA